MRTPVDGLGGEPFDRGLEERVSESELPAKEGPRGRDTGWARGQIGHRDHGRDACGAASPRGGMTAGRPNAANSSGPTKKVRAAIESSRSVSS